MHSVIMRAGKSTASFLAGAVVFGIGVTVSVATLGMSLGWRSVALALLGYYVVKAGDAAESKVRSLLNQRG